MSKVAVSIDGAPPFPIPLGQCEGDPVKEFLIDSSLLFATDARIYFGTYAVRKSQENLRLPQRRYDSLKGRLTTGDKTELGDVKLPSLLNSTGVEFSIADAMALMFAHIFRLTHDYLRQEYEDGVLGNVSYRFTRPVFNEERGAWVDRHMVCAIAAGLSLEVQLGKSYAGSIDAKDARNLIDQSAKKKNAKYRKISSHGIPEPVAAGILVLSQVPDRRFLSAIVDIGAGTTDIALFAGVQPAGNATVDRVRTQGNPVSIANAGDHVDEFIKQMVEEGFQGALTARDRIEIEQNIRRWKEDVFKFGEAIPILSGGKRLARITHHKLTLDARFLKMQQELIEALMQVLKSAESIIDTFATSNAPPLYRPVTSIEIVPCGGGANLPIFKEIALRHWRSSPSGKTLGFDVQKPVPAVGGNYDESFPQLAVALGGAVRDQPVVNGANPN